MNANLENALNEYAEKMSWKLVDYTTNYNPFHRIDLSQEYLETLRNNFGDIEKARYVNGNCKRISYVKNFYQMYDLIKEVSILMNGFARPSGLYYYPMGGYCGWHTNSDSPGLRVYLTWAEEGGKSFFRYLDNETGKIVTKYDTKGWSINTFEATSGDKPLWHCVSSDTNRVSIGFTLDNEHWLSKHYLKYDMNDTKSIGEKVDSCCKNYLLGNHSMMKNSNDGHDWSVNGIEGYIPVRYFDDFLLHTPPVEISLDIISWKCKDNIELKDYKMVDTDIPVMVVETYMNPHKLQYRTIDGSHRLCKLKSKKIEKVWAIIISEEYFYEAVMFFNI